MDKEKELEKEVVEWSPEDKVLIKKNENIYLAPEHPSIISIGELLIQSKTEGAVELSKIAERLIANKNIKGYLDRQRNKMPSMIA